ncbi:unnamed protein product [Prunus armeniaca]|uniref:Uncharacterized protein n=1 Tax=Prunus armeniaca TaxID=36596 RepID=A0A6J5USZ3_PRUAR|nr:unnamed protein product [Prunus armeniaca]
MLIGIEGCQETIVQAWEDTPGSVVAKLSFCQLALKRWNNEHVGNIPRKVRFLQNRTDDLQGLASTSEPFNEHKRLAKEMDVFMEREEVLCHQWVRINWLKQGDKNMRFFSLASRTAG